jgi:hypothetical protein
VNHLSPFMRYTIPIADRTCDQNKPSSMFEGHDGALLGPLLPINEPQTSISSESRRGAKISRCRTRRETRLDKKVDLQAIPINRNRIRVTGQRLIRLPITCEVSQKKECIARTS